MTLTFDATRLTAFSESSPRIRDIDTLQYHHAATTSLDALEYNMEPGGREVSANCAPAFCGVFANITATAPITWAAGDILAGGFWGDLP